MRGMHMAGIWPALGCGGSALAWVAGVLVGGLPLPSVAADPRMAIGADFAVVSRTDGSVWSWGRGNDGELGQGTRTNVSTPGQVLGLSGVVDVAAAEGITLALKADGTVWVWGFGSFGILGSGVPEGASRSIVPVQIRELSDIRSIAIGRGSSSAWAVDGRGQVFNWGINSRGQFGLGVAGSAAEVRPVPQRMTNLDNATSVVAGDIAFLATRNAAGEVAAWGYSPENGLGVGVDAPLGGPPLAVRAVTGLTNVRSLATADINGGSHYAVRNDGFVAGWGSNRATAASCGQADSGTAVITAPRTLANLSGVVQASGGAGHVLFLTEAGQVLACGAGAAGQMGDGTAVGTGSAKPGPVRSGLSVTAHAVAAGRNSSGAIGTDGSVWIWGQVANGLAGDGGSVSGTTSQRNLTSPQRVAGLAGVGSFDAGARASAAGLYVGTLTGPLSAAGLNVGVAPSPADVGKIGATFVAVALPNGTLLFNNGTPSGWTPYTGGTPPAYSLGPLPRHLPMPLASNLNLTGITGVRVFTAYGVGADVGSAVADLLARGTFGVALTIN
jgi:alpha-tubulin suppressor-like RCC1 family protein